MICQYRAGCRLLLRCGEGLALPRPGASWPVRLPHGVHVLLAPRDQLVIGFVDVEGLEGEAFPGGVRSTCSNRVPRRRRVDLDAVSFGVGEPDGPLVAHE